MKKKIIFIILLSLAIQLAYLLFNPVTCLKADADNYDKIGFNIASGKGFSLDGKNPIAMYPLYPIFLSVIYKIFGHCYFIPMLLSALFLALFCALVYLIGRRAFNERAAFISAIFLALYPPVFTLARMMYAEPLFLFLLYSSLFLLYIFTQTEKKLFFISAAITLAAAILTKPQVIYFPLVIALIFFLLFPFKKAAVFSLLLALTILACMLPWTMRNYLVFRDFRPIGTLAIKEGRITKVDIAADYNKESVVKGFYQRQEERLKDYYAKKEITPVKDRQEGTVKKIARYFGSDDSGNPKNFFDFIRKLYITSYSDILGIGIPLRVFVEDQNIMKGYWWMFLVKALVIIASFLIFILGTIGAILSFRRWRETIIFSSLFISYTIFLYLWVLFFGQVGICGRYNLPVLGVLVMFAFGQIIKGGAHK